MKNMFVGCLLVSGLLAVSLTGAVADEAAMDAGYVEELDVIEADGGALIVTEEDVAVYADEETGDVLVDDVETTALVDEDGTVLEEDVVEEVEFIEAADFPVEE